MASETKKQAKPIVVYKQGGYDVATVEVKNPKNVVTKTIDVYVTLPVGVQKTSKPEVKSTPQPYHSTPGPPGGGGGSGSGNAEEVDKKALDELNEYYSILNDIYWQIVSLGVPRGLPLLEDMKSTMNKISDLIDQVKNYLKDKKEIPDSLKDSIDNTVDTAQSLINEAQDYLKAKKPIGLETASALILNLNAENLASITDVAKIIIPELKARLDAIEAFLYQLAPELTEKDFNYVLSAIETVRNKIDNVENELKSPPPPDHAKEWASDIRSSLVKIIASVSQLQNSIAKIAESKVDVSKMSSKGQKLFNYIILGDKADFKKLDDEYKKLMQDYSVDCAGYPYATTDPYCKSVDDYLQHYGFPLTNEAMQFLEKYMKYYKEIESGNKPKVGFGTKAKWDFEKVAGVVFGLMGLANKAGEGLKEYAEELENEAKKEGGFKGKILEGLSYLIGGTGTALPVLGALATGAGLGALDLVTGGLLTPVLVAMGVGYIADQMADPLQRKAFLNLVERAKKGDRQAQLLLGEMVGSAIAMIIGAKIATEGIGNLKVGEDMTLKDLVANKIDTTLGNIIAKMQKNGKVPGWVVDTLSKLRQRYYMQILGKKAPDIENENVVVDIFPDKDGNMYITIAKKGKITGEDVVVAKIPHETLAGLEKWGVTSGGDQEILSKIYLSNISEGDTLNDVVAKTEGLERLFKIVSNKNLVEEAKKAGFDIPKIIKDLIEGKGRINAVIIKGEKRIPAIEIERSEAEGNVGTTAYILTGDPKNPLFKVSIQKFKGDNLAYVKISDLEEANTAEAFSEYLNKIGLKYPEDAYDLLSRLGEIGTSDVVVDAGNTKFIARKGLFVSIATRKGAMTYIKGGDLVISVGEGEGKQVIEVPEDVLSNFDHLAYVDSKDGTFMSKTYIKFKLTPELEKFFDKFMSRTGLLNDMVNDAYKLLKEGKDVSDVKGYLINKYENQLDEIAGGDSQLVKMTLDQAINLAKIAKNSPTEGNINLIMGIRDGVEGKEGYIGIVGVNSTSVLNKTANQLTDQQAQQIVSQFKDEIAGKSPKEILKTLSKELGVKPETAGILMTKSGLIPKVEFKTYSKNYIPTSAGVTITETLEKGVTSNTRKLIEAKTKTEKLEYYKTDYESKPNVVETITTEQTKEEDIQKSSNVNAPVEKYSEYSIDYKIMGKTAITEKMSKAESEYSSQSTKYNAPEEKIVTTQKDYIKEPRTTITDVINKSNEEKISQSLKYNAPEEKFTFTKKDFVIKGKTAITTTTSKKSNDYTTQSLKYETPEEKITVTKKDFINKPRATVSETVTRNKQAYFVQSLKYNAPEEKFTFTKKDFVEEPRTTENLLVTKNKEKYRSMISKVNAKEVEVNKHLKTFISSGNPVSKKTLSVSDTSESSKETEDIGVIVKNPNIVTIEVTVPMYGEVMIPYVSASHKHPPPPPPNETTTQGVPLIPPLGFPAQQAVGGGGAPPPLRGRQREKVVL